MLCVVRVSTLWGCCVSGAPNCATVATSGHLGRALKVWSCRHVCLSSPKCRTVAASNPSSPHPTPSNPSTGMDPENVPWAPLVWKSIYRRYRDGVDRDGPGKCSVGATCVEIYIPTLWGRGRPGCTRKMFRRRRETFQRRQLCGKKYTDAITYAIVVLNKFKLPHLDSLENNIA